MPVPLVSVVIPVFGEANEAFAPEAIASVRAQTVPAEIIVVGEEPINGADKFVRDYGQGVWLARNCGIDEASGTYIICLDADDKLEPTYIEKALAMADKAEDKDKVIVSSHMQEFGLRSNVWDLPVYSKDLLAEANILHCASMFSKELWALSGGYPPAIGYEDWEFWIRLSRLDPEVFIIPERLLQYRVHSANSTHTKTHLDKVLRAMIHFRNPDRYHNYPGRFQESVETIMKMDDDAYRRITKLLPHAADPNLVAFTYLAFQYRKTLVDDRISTDQP